MQTANRATSSTEGLIGLDDELRPLLAVYDRNIDALNQARTRLAELLAQHEADHYSEIGIAGIAEARATIAALQPRTKHCGCGNPIGPKDEWCSHSCYRNEVGFEEPHDELADPNEEGPFG